MQGHKNANNSFFPYSYDVFCPSKANLTFEPNFVCHMLIISTLTILEILLFELGLTLYHTIRTFNDPKEEGFEKHSGKRRKCR